MKALLESFERGLRRAAQQNAAYKKALQREKQLKELDDLLYTSIPLAPTVHKETAAPVQRRPSTKRGRYRVAYSQLLYKRR